MKAIGTSTLFGLVALCLLASAAIAQSGRPWALQADEDPTEEQPGLVPAPGAERLPSSFRRQLVFYRTAEPPGTIIVETGERFLYHVQGDGRAMRYGIGVG